MKRIHLSLLKIGGWVLALILVAKCAVFAFSWNHPINQFRRLLSDRHEERSASDEFGDYSLCIAGRLPASRFKEAAELLGLSGNLRDDPKQLEGWQQIVDEAWWDVPEYFDEQYYKKGEGWSALFGRSGDRVFYQALSW
ncbi:MAG: hypothetical protein U1G05_10565 [Kiritimatiellia bacterium]